MLAFLPPFWPSTLTFAFFINTITFETLSFFGKDINFSAVCVRWSERWPLSFPMIASQHCLSYLLTKIGFLKQFLCISWEYFGETQMIKIDVNVNIDQAQKNIFKIRRELKGFLFANLSHKSLWLVFMTAVVSMWHT